MSTELDRITELARRTRSDNLFDRSHDHVRSVVCGIPRITKESQRGVDGVTYEEYERDVAGNIQTLTRGSRMASIRPPFARVYIPKENGKQTNRDSALEDKIVQKPWSNTECHLRAGFSRLLVRVPTRKRAAPRLDEVGESFALGPRDGSWS